MTATRPLAPGWRDLPVRGRNLSGDSLGALLGEATLLVFLRHLG